MSKFFYTDSNLKYAQKTEILKSDQFNLADPLFLPTEQKKNHSFSSIYFNDFYFRVIHI